MADSIPFLEFQTRHPLISVVLKGLTWFYQSVWCFLLVLYGLLQLIVYYLPRIGLVIEASIWCIISVFLAFIFPYIATFVDLPDDAPADAIIWGNLYCVVFSPIAFYCFGIGVDKIIQGTRWFQSVDIWAYYMRFLGGYV